MALLRFSLIAARPGVPEALIGAGGGIALRHTPHPTAVALIEACCSALVGTSANRSGGSPATHPSSVVEAFRGEIAVVLDGGTTPGGPPSTLLDLTGSEPRIVRPGAVPADRIAEAIRLL